MQTKDRNLSKCLGYDQLPNYLVALENAVKQRYSVFINGSRKLILVIDLPTSHNFEDNYVKYTHITFSLRKTYKV